MTAFFQILDWAAATAAERARILTRGGHASKLGADSELRVSIQQIVEDVRDRGDQALVDALRKYDQLDLPLDRIRVSEHEIERARSEISGELLDAIRISIEQSRRFNELIRDRGAWVARTPSGVVVGETVSPIPSVGLFLPCGKNSFPSVAIQVATPAMVAGVPRVAVVVPPLPNTAGTVDPATLVALSELGVSEIYRANGPAGIAALALGTSTIARVDKIVGPGSPGVIVAEMLVQQFGTVVEVGFGPTDSLILADSSADATLLAADLLNEAEHGPDSSAVLVSTDRALLERASRQVLERLQALPEPRRSYAAKSIRENGGFVYAVDDAVAAAIADAYAPEHLQLAVRKPEEWLGRVRYAGTTLLGQWTTFAMSNFATGTPATLPTTGYARVSSGVTAHTYLVRQAVAGLTEDEFWRLAPTVAAFCDHEDFPAHAATIEVRRP